MSRVVDQRVVEMQFDNRHFERNVSTTMSTLDKLKSALNFKGAEKGFQDLNRATKQVDFSRIENAAYTSGFSIQDVWLKTASVFEYQVARRIVNAASNMTKALTIDPIKTGFQEYETQINAVQTILANTSSKGSTIDDVNKALEELNKYADMTIYNFTEMTRNIGTFTAAGVDLDTSVNAIKGIANLAAVSGSTSQQASTAMYQLSQALASGTVKLMDWNSVVNAGMGGEVFQNALKDTARIHGVAIDQMIEKEGSFRDSLKNEWLTSEILTETLEKFTLTAKEGGEEWEKLKKSLKEKGYTEEQAAEILKMGNTATDAATKVKTFTQLWDVMKESAQSGWSQTWKIIIGDFEEAKALLTPIADIFTGIIGKMSDARNVVLESALGKGFTHILDGFEIMKKSVDGVLEPLNAASAALEDLGAIADKVIYGAFGNGQERFDALTEAGYNYYRVQNKVNETLDNAYRYSDEQIAAQDKLLGLQTKTTDSAKEQSGATFELTDANKELLKSLLKMNNAELIANGYTREQVEALRELRMQAERLGIPLDEFVDKLDEINGRWLLINSFKNIGKGLVDTFNAIKVAWEGIFPPKSVEERAEGIFNLIAGFHKLTSTLTGVVYENGKLTDTGEKLVRTFQGLFAIIDIITTVTGGAFKFAFNLAKEVLSLFHLDILDVTAGIGDAIVKFRDFIDRTLDVSGVIEKIAPHIKTAIEAIGGWIDSFKESQFATDAISAIGTAVEFVKNKIEELKGSLSFDKISSFFKNTADGIREWIDGFKTTDNIPKYIIEGLANGLRDGAKAVWEGMTSLAKKAWDAFCDFFGIHSPSTLMIAAGGFIIAGLITGLTQGFGTVAEAGTDVATGLFHAIKDVLLNLFDYLKNIDFGSVLSVAGLAGMFFIFNKVADAIGAIGKIFDGIGDIFEGLGGVLEGFEKNLKASALEKKSKALLNMALAIGILVAALYVLTQMCSKEKVGDLLLAVGILVAIAGVLVGMSVAIDKLTKAGGFKVAALGASLLALGITMLLLAATAKIMGGMEAEAFERGAAAVIAFGTMIMLLVAATQKMPSGGVKGLGGSIMAVGLAMLMMAGVAKIISGMTWNEMGKAAAGIGAFTLVIVALTAATRLAGGGKKIASMGSVITAVGTAMLLMAIVAKIIAGMTWDEMGKAAVGIGAFTLIIVGLIAATNLAGNKIKSAGSMIASVGAAMLMMAITSKIIAGMTWDEMGKAAVGLVALGGIITGLIAATRLAGPGELKRVGTTLLMMSLSIGILGLIAALLGMMKIESLAKGVIAVGLLGAIMSLMIIATKGAQDCKGNIIAMSIAIGIMAIAVAALSFIDPEKLKAPIAAMGLLMGMFSVMLAASKLATGSLGVVITLGVVVGLLGGILILMGKLQIENTMGNAIALSALILALSGAMVLLSVAGKTGGSALVGVLALTAMAVPLLAFVGVLALMQNVQNAMSNVAALSLFAAALTVMLIPLTLVGSLVAPALLGVLALTAMAVPLLAFVGILAVMENIQNAEENINALIKMTAALTAILTVLAIIGPMALIGVGALASLTALMVGLGALAVGIGALVEKFPALETFLDKGVALLEDLAYGLGSVLGHFITGFSEEVMSLLPKLGTSLSDFMVNATPFIEGASKINGKMLDGVKALAETVLILTAVDIVEGLTSWLTGGDSLASFGEQLPKLGRDLSAFASSLGTFDDAKVTTVNCAANAIKAIADVAGELPNDGGWLGKIVGENDIATFGGYLPQLGTHLATFANNLGTFDDSKVTTITCASDAIKAIANAASELPNNGGWLGAIVGENDLATFGGYLPQLGSCLSEFAGNLGTFDDAKVSTITCAADAIKVIADVASSLPNEGGWLSSIVGENDIGTFGEYLPELGTHLSNFASNLGTFNDAKVATVSCAVRAIKAIGELANSDLYGASTYIGYFGEELVLFGEDLSAFCGHLSDTSGIDQAAANLQTILEAIGDVSDADAGVLSNLSKSLKSIGENGVNSFIKAFTNSTAKTDIKRSAADLMNKAIAGFESKKNSFDDTVDDLMSSAGSRIRTSYQSFYNAGAYLGDGLSAGIGSKVQKVANQATSMVTAAINAAKEAAGIASPSKVFYRLGEFTGMGFVNALVDYCSKSYNAAYEMADSARSGLSDTISRIASVIDSDMDFQPTIRPVLDMSDVRAGAGAISSMFNRNPSIGVLANVGAISTQMSRSGQNGTNADVVSAINKLRGDISGLGTTQYNINGITYDDGSNIADAVKTIARRVKIERRV